MPIQQVLAKTNFFFVARALYIAEFYCIRSIFIFFSQSISCTEIQWLSLTFDICLCPCYHRIGMLPALLPPLAAAIAAIAALTVSVSWPIRLHFLSSAFPVFLSFPAFFFHFVEPSFTSASPRTTHVLCFKLSLYLVSAMELALAV